MWTTHIRLHLKWVQYFTRLFWVTGSQRLNCEAKNRREDNYIHGQTPKIAVKWYLLRKTHQPFSKFSEQAQSLMKARSLNRKLKKSWWFYIERSYFPTISGFPINTEIKVFGDSPHFVSGWSCRRESPSPRCLKWPIWPMRTSSNLYIRKSFDVE